YDLLSIEVLTLLSFCLLLVFIMLGVPLAFVLGGLSIIFLYFDMWTISFYLIASQMWDLMETSSLIAIPLYVFMALLLERSGVAHNLYQMMHLWWGGFRGGLAIGTVGICTIF